MENKFRELKIKDDIVLIDEDMYPIISKFTWYVRKDKNTKYASTSIKIGANQHIIQMHRLLTGMKGSLVDHRNRNGLDNRLSNLRYATNKQNSYNRIRSNKYGYRGVFIPQGCKTFAIQIQKDGKKITRYGYKTAIEAAMAYDVICKEYQGEFGILNFPEGVENERV